LAEHPNVTRIKDMFAAFATGDSAVLNDVFAEDLLWHEGGRNQLSGDYRGREAVFGFFGKFMEATQGSFRLDVHAVLADDEHGVALVVISASRGGRSITVNAVDVMHLRDGKVAEVWTVPADQYAFDEVIG
jgi:ketosteroid isomerase-like protein